MSASREEIRNAVNAMMNDVMEQCFSHLIHYPQDSDYLNRVIKVATEELNRTMNRIDAHEFENESKNLEEHYNDIYLEVHRKSLYLLSRLQLLQKEQSTNVSDE